MSAAPSIDLSVFAKLVDAEPASGPMPAPRSRPRLTVVGRFELEGRVYVVAQEDGAPAAGMNALTPREKDIVARAIRGDTAKEIAYDLGISHSTVRVLLARSYRRFGVKSRAELVAAVTRPE